MLFPAIVQNFVSVASKYYATVSWTFLVKKQWTSTTLGMRWSSALPCCRHPRIVQAHSHRKRTVTKVNFHHRWPGLLDWQPHVSFDWETICKCWSSSWLGQAGFEVLACWHILAWLGKTKCLQKYKMEGEFFLLRVLCCKVQYLLDFVYHSFAHVDWS